MKKLILIISMALASSITFAQNSNDNTLYIIDGVVATKAAADELPSDAIRNMNIVKGIESVVIITTQAGREISGRVVDVEGKSIGGLYAAGELANSNFYYTTYTCGTAFGSAVIFGRIAGASAAANLK